MPTVDESPKPRMADQSHETSNIAASVASPHSSDKESSYKDVLAALIACIGALSAGLAIGYSNPALQDDRLLDILGDAERQSWFGSLVAMGAIFGGPCAGFLVAKCGRKGTMMLTIIPMGLGWFIIICGSHFVHLYIGRLANGFAIGMSSMVVPLYSAEVANTARRGLLGSGFQLFVSIGILVVYSLGVPLGYCWLAVACLSASTLNVVLLLVVPDSPRWLASQKRRLEALDALAWLTGGDAADLEGEYAEMERNLGASQKAEGGGEEGVSWRDFALPELYRPMLISILMMVYQQMCGINPVIFYSSEIFASSGFAADPKLPTLTIGAVLVLATVVSCVLIDRAGRRILLLASGVPMVLSLTLLGTCFYMTSSGPVYGLSWVSLMSTLIFVISFSLGIGPISWVVVSEVVPSRARTIINGTATCLVWLLLFVLTKEFGRMRRVMHDYGAFWFFAGCSLVCLVLVGFFVPETKGKTLEEIQEIFTSSPKSEINLKDVVTQELLNAKKEDEEKKSP